MNSLLPPSATPLMLALEGADAAGLDAIETDVVATLATPDVCPAKVLPFLGWGYSVDAWSTEWTDAEKRAVVAAALGIHARKGTRGGLDDAVAPFGAGLIIQEWWQADPPAAPHTFTVRVTAGGQVRPADWFRALYDTVDQTKPRRDHYSVLVDQTATGAVEVGVIGSAAVFAHFDTTATRAA